MSSKGSPSRKRDHATFQEAYETQDLEEPCSVPQDFLDKLAAEETQASESLPTPPVSIGTKRDPSPTRSSTGSLTDAGSTTPSYRDQSPIMGDLPASSTPSAFAALNGTSAPPPKKARISFQEKEHKRLEKEAKDRLKAEERVRREAEKQVHAEEKARKDAEKEAERKRKEAEREEKRAVLEAEKAVKEAEREEKRAALEAEKALKEEKRKKKEEEKQKAEEEKRKKERGQMKLGSFFAVPAVTRPRGGSVESGGRTSMSPAPQSSGLSAAIVASPMKTPGKPEKTPYEKLFPDFFKQSGVTVAPTTRFERDEEAVRAIETTIDSYILGNRSPGRQRTFDAPSLFHTSPDTDVPRGRRRMPVREIMSEVYSSSGDSSKPIDLTTDSQNSQIKRTGDLLKKIPMKFLQFQEDVRPPYRGTYTNRPVTGMTKLARNPLRRDLPNTDYDYDSEAEWVEDEDAEDLKSEGDEEEELDDDEDMHEFLDDENDETANSRRLVLQGDLEPVSTGLCWEDRKRRNSSVRMIAYRMEVILDPNIKSIDPFASTYWDSPAIATTAMDPPRVPLKSTSSNINISAIAVSSPKPIKTFFAPASSSSNPPKPTTQLPNTQPPLKSNPKSKENSKDAKPKKLVSENDMAAFKAAIQGSDLSKVGLIEVLKKKFPGRSGAAIKGTLETVAKRVGVKEVDKRWVLLD